MLGSATAFLHGKLIYLNPNLSPKLKTELETMVKALGGELVQKVDSTVIAITTASCLQPKEIYNTIIRATPDWIRLIAKNGRDYNPKYFAADRKMIFSGFIVHYYNQNENQSVAEILYGGVAAFGGQYRIHADTDLTHLVTNSDQDEILQQYKNSGVKLILPEFFDDCFRLNLLCNDSHYLFPDPVIRNCDLMEMFKLSSTESKQSSLESIEVESPIFSGIIFYIDKTVFDSSKSGAQNRLNMIQVLESNGAIVSEEFEKSSVLIIDEQVGYYLDAKRKNMTIGTVRWLKDQIKQQKRLNTNQVLHYPRLSVSVPEFTKFNITVTNYSGRAREDILKMAVHLGATVSRNMTISNTHLICGAPMGDKYVRALKWNINIVNHIWLEESYSNWKYIVEARPRFLQFSPGIGDYVGNSEFREEIMKESKGPEEQVKHISIIQKRKPIENVSSNKRSKNNPIKIVFTGLRSKDIRKSDVIILKDLEIYIAEDLSEFDYLVTRKIARSEKFMIAVGRGCPIIDYTWIQACVAKNERQNIENYMLNDPENEKKFKFCLQKSIMLAKKTPLLKNLVVCTTKNTIPTFESMQRIVDSAGGDVQQIESAEDAKVLTANSEVKPIVISCERDMEIIKELKEFGLTVYNSEFLLNAILTQSLTLSEEYTL